MEDIRNIDNPFDRALAMIRLSKTIDDAQEYFMGVAKNYSEVTFTFKNEKPFVTAFLGKGSDQLIGFGPSVAAALADALNTSSHK
jgi:hypothetical protein